MNSPNSPLQGGEVLLLIDWENVFFSLFNDFGPDKLNLDNRFEKLITWVKKEVGDILEDHGFIFAPEHFTAYHREICVKNKLRIIVCPKRQIHGKEEDTVDETIIWFGNMMMHHQKVKFLCLVSGDEDFAPLLQEAKKQNINVALVVPTLNSISTNKVMINFVDVSPKTGKKMSLRLDKV